jgi:indoleamine 2,3-dioxygenase
MPGITTTTTTTTETPFPVLHDARPEDTSLPAFMVSTARGFLPRADPPATLPAAFDALESLLRRMPVRTLDGTPGLLASSALGPAVQAELPDLTAAVDDVAEDLPLVNALYRDYAFLASAYLLEPCHERFVRGEPYGLARDVLPKQVARPIARCAEICGFKPWMEYAGSYALFNYRLEDPAQGMEYSNLRLIRAFEQGLDPTSSEAGFVLVHVAMAKNTGPLVAGALSCLDAAAAAAHNPSSSPSSSSSSPSTLRGEFNSGLANMLSAMRIINDTMETMWAKSKPTMYTSFRTFIFGITNQSMFPNGVVYEGVGDEKPMSFRGESGANDSIVPLVDNLCQIAMPKTPLTEILADFRSYRPSNHRAFLEHVRDRSLAVGVKDYALALDDEEEEEEEEEEQDLTALAISRGTWLRLLDTVREFRWRHWCFAREYILKRTSHPTATGGSPIVTWLPNQLQAVLSEMERVYEAASKARGGVSGCEEIMDRVRRQRETLNKEVDKYCQERGVSRSG